MVNEGALPPPWSGLVDRLDSATPLTVERSVVITSGQRVVMPPPEVLTAFERAGREALRNAATHAGVDSIQVDLVLTRHGASLRVADRGAGFDRGGDLGQRGLQHSIVEVIESVGGQAEIRSTVGYGTEVRMTWELRAGLTVALERNHDAQDAMRRALLFGVVAPLTAANLALAGTQQVAGSDNGPMWAIVVAATGLVAWTAYRMRRAPGVLDVLVVALLAPTLTGIALSISGAEALVGLSSWYVGFLSLPLVMFAFVVPPRLLPLLLGPQAALVAVTSMTTAGVGSAGFGAVNSVVLPSVVSWALGTFLRRSGRAMQAEQQRLAVAQARSAADRAAAELRHQHLSDAVDDVAPFLAGIVSGQLDADDGDVRAASNVLLQFARDDLYVPGYFSPELRELAREFRSRGGQLRIAEGFPPGAEHRPDGQVLGLLLQHLDGAAEVHVSLRPVDPLPVRLVVSPPVSDSLADALITRCREWGARVESTAYQTAVRLPAPLDSGMARDQT